MRTRLALALLLLPARAFADGAFPDSMRILLPADHPEQILVGTNFGLLVSSDGGAHFRLVCEEAITHGGENVTQYQMGPAPASTIYALASNELGRSADRGCAFTAATGTWKDPFLTDAFADPVTAGQLYTLALVPAPGGGMVSALFASRDDGRTFAEPIYTAAPSIFLTGVESAAAAPNRLYVTGFDFQTNDSVLARSSDGRTFRTASLAPILGNGEVRLAAVHPLDANVVYYRVIDVDGDKLAITRDGGDTARVALRLTGEMTTFLRRADGTLLVGTRVEGAFLSRDDGATFEAWPEAPNLRGLSERDGILYAVADNARDPFAVGSSSDGGKTWKALLRFQGICGILACSAAVSDTCAPAWRRLVDLLGITATCEAPDAGVRDAPGADGAAGQGGKGCSCSLGGQTSGGGAAMLALAWLLRRRRPRL